MVVIIMVLIGAVFAVGLAAVYGLLRLWARMSEEKQGHKEPPTSSIR